MSTMYVKDANGTPQLVALVGSTGQTTAAESLPVVFPADTAGMVTSNRVKFSDNFFSLDTTNNWDLVQTGSGQTVSVAGTSNGSRYLNIATGVTTNSETILLSKKTFRLPIELCFGLSMSQRIANQSVYVEFVGVDSSGEVETDATFTGTESENAKNLAGFRFSATTATQAFYIVRGAAISESVSAATTFGTTAATGTTPNFIPASIFDINADHEEIVFTSRAVDSSAVNTLGGKRTSVVLDPNKDYKIRIRVANGAVAPASTTDVRLHFVTAMSSNTVSVDFMRYMGRSDLSDSLPVIISNTPTVSGSISLVSATAAGGIATVSRLLTSAATVNSTLVKGSVGRIYSIGLYNSSATVKFLKLYNKATAPTVGTDTPLVTIALPPTSAYIHDFDVGISFSLGIGYGITGAVADADTTAIAAGDILGLNIYYA